MRIEFDGLRPRVYLGTSSTGARVCDEVLKRLARTRRIKTEAYACFENNTYPALPFVMRDSGFVVGLKNRHEFIKKVASSLEQHVDYSRYQELRSPNKALFAQELAETIKDSLSRAELSYGLASCPGEMTGVLMVPAIYIKASNSLPQERLNSVVRQALNDLIEPLAHLNKNRVTVEIC